MKRIDKLAVSFNGTNVGTLTTSPDKRICVFEYAREWLVEGFSISPLELPLQPGTFIAKPMPFDGGFGIYFMI